MDVSTLGNYFYKCRVIGPMLPPISHSTRLEIEKLNVKPRNLLFEEKIIVGIKGDMYNSRLKLINELKNGLSAHKLNVDLRVISKDKNLSSELYWKELLDFDIVLTTTKQGIHELFTQNILPYKVDFTDINQIVFRITEALVCNRVLLCENAPGLDLLFDTSSELIVYEDVNQLLEKLEFYSLNREELIKLRNAGNARIRLYLEAHFFWNTITAELN